jgi:uncharacterized membrane protein YfcA
MDLLAVILASAAVVFLASLVQGLTGFGSALVMVPILVNFMPPRMVVPLSLLSGTVINLILALRERRHLQGKMVATLLIPALIGLPLGTLLLLFAEGNLIRIVIGVIIITSALLLVAGFRFDIRREIHALIPAGFLSGLLNSSVSMSGPPLILLFQNQRMPKDLFRANLVTYFLAVNLFTIPAFMIAGLFDERIIAVWAAVIPSIVIGISLGSLISKKVDQVSFRRLVLILVALSGLSALISGVYGLF